MLYPLSRRLARIALAWYYRRVEVVGTERVPLEGPLLVVANHPNAMMDPMLVATTLPRRVTFTGKATLFENPFTRAFLSALGFVPLRRASDERRQRGGAARGPDPGRNVEAFRAIVDALRAGRAVLIFPEGKSHDDPAIAPLKTGSARLALQAVGDGVGDLRILPVGLVFEDKAEPRTRVLVELGEPFAVGRWLEAAHVGEAGRVERLTAEIDRRLRALTLNFATLDAAAEAVAVATTLAESGGKGTLGTGVAYRDSVDATRRVEEAMRALPDADPALAGRAAALGERVRRVRARVAAAGLDPLDLAVDVGAAGAGWFALREGAIALVGWPVALAARVVHWLPITVARAIARRSSRSGADPAMHTVVAGSALVLAAYAAVAVLVSQAAGPLSALGAILVLPVLATWDFRLRDRTARAVRRIAAWRVFRRDPALQASFTTELTALRDEAIAIESALAATRSRVGEPAATGA